MDPDVSPGVIKFGAPAEPGEARQPSVGASTGTIKHGAPPSAIDRITAVSSDQIFLGRFVSLLLFRAQYFVLHRIYGPRPPKHSRLLNLGCGDSHLDGWVNADRLRITYLLLNARKVLQKSLKLPDWTIDAAWRWNCPDNYWEGIYTENVLEHLSYRDVVVTLKEVLRTLQPGRWLRVLLPDLARYVEFYNSKANGTPANSWFEERFAFGAEAIAFLTQNQSHASVWDARLLSAVLAEIGFTNVATVAFGCGSDPRLMMDNVAGRYESLYVEAQKPAQ